MTLALGAIAVLVAALVKGAIGFGFPTLGTPLVSLVTDVQSAVVLLILPNIVMDGIQFHRRGAPVAVVRRFSTLLVGGSVGMILGTRLLIGLSPRTAGLVLSLFILLFVVSSAVGLDPRVPARWEAWVSPVVGLVAGVVGGITNVPGTPLVLYFRALALAKHEFVSAVAFTFVVYKLVQLGAVVYFGLMSWTILAGSAALTVAALGGFAVGLWVQDRLAATAFNRAVLGFLACLGIGLFWRSLSAP
jgi:hypothetical protein